MLRERLSHPLGHKDHKTEPDGSELAHQLPTHAQKDAYTAGWAQGPPPPLADNPPQWQWGPPRGAPHAQRHIAASTAPVRARSHDANAHGARYPPQRLPRAAKPER